MQLRSGWAQPSEILWVYFIAIVEQNKKRIKKKEQKLKPVVKLQPIPTIFDAKSERLGAVL
jgi:hypothetical protein